MELISVCVVGDYSGGTKKPDTAGVRASKNLENVKIRFLYLGSHVFECHVVTRGLWTHDWTRVLVFQCCTTDTDGKTNQTGQDYGPECL